MQYKINGGHKLKGEVKPVGNKNSVLKLIPASILFKGDYILENVPAILDVQVMVEILQDLGAEVDYRKEEGYLKINTENVSKTEIDEELAKRVRASVLFYGPLLARFGEVKGVFPGGDKIGPRELKAHFSGFLQMGVEFSGNEWGEFKLSGKPQGGDIFLYEPSVTATENLILAAAAAEGKTTIRGAAAEPHVQEMCELLQESGVEISGIGSSVLHIEGKIMLEGNAGLEQKQPHKIWPDHIDIGTLIASSVVTNGELLIKGVRHKDLKTILFFFEQLGVSTEAKGADLFVPENQIKKVKDANWARVKGIYSQPWYSFPTDLMSVTIAMSLYVEGTILFFEKMFPDRMAFAVNYNNAGGNVIICDPYRLIITGGKALQGHDYQAPDIRAGMAFFVASLGADGESTISNVEHIERGYPNTIERFRALGAEVAKV
ncbi:MAG: UDP-N-acetylglucosamine 1-carboxyvinyltransferase [Candidatus Dojkabacteria bacterium]